MNPRLSCLRSRSASLRSPSVRRAAISLGSVALFGVLSACAADAPTSDTVAPTSVAPSTLPPDRSTALEIVVGVEGEPNITVASLSVDDGGVATGSGYLADPARASSAAELLKDPAVVKRLVEGEPQGQMCTEIYGGPDIATVTGTLDGVAVNTSFNRNNGCGIADWELLLPLLTRSHWDGAGRLYLRGESPIAVAAGTTFSIELESNPTTGYEWVVQVSDSAVVTAGASTYLPPADVKPGAGGYQRIAFTAASAGTATITLEYRRSFEPPTTPAVDTVTYDVTVNG